MKEIYISVDIEADGPYPGDYSMVSIGAVAAGMRTRDGEIHRFNFHNDEENRFYAEIQPISDNYIPSALEVGTFKGIPADSNAQQIREYLLEHGETAEDAMTRFAQWCFTLKKEHPGAALVFAAYPLGFDWMFTYWYLAKFTEFAPQVFGHSRHLDMKTEYSSQYDTLIRYSTKRNMPKSLLKSEVKHTHNALDDAAGQADLLMNLLKPLK